MSDDHDLDRAPLFEISRIPLDDAANNIFVLQTDMQLSHTQLIDLRERWYETWERFGLPAPRTIILTAGVRLNHLSDLALKDHGLKRINR